MGQIVRYGLECSGGGGAAQLVVALEHDVVVVDGDPLGAKVTTADDLERAQWLLRRAATLGG